MGDPPELIRRSTRFIFTFSRGIYRVIEASIVWYLPELFLGRGYVDTDRYGLPTTVVERAAAGYVHTTLWFRHLLVVSLQSRSYKI